MSGYNSSTEVFELTATKGKYWFRRKDVPAELKQGVTDDWELVKRVIVWQGLTIIKDGGNYVQVKATSNQLWEALSGQPSHRGNYSR